VTDHEEFAYFARRYGFEVVGTVIPAASAAAEPSARGLAALEDAIRSTGVRAVFVSSVVTPGLASQVAQDTGIRLVTLYAHSLTDGGGPAPSYLELMRLNARRIAEALTH
jgi:ABC-type Zn uptake system ZnuABC Zn-binding protein ZnuA